MAFLFRVDDYSGRTEPIELDLAASNRKVPNSLGDGDRSRPVRAWFSDLSQPTGLELVAWPRLLPIAQDLHVQKMRYYCGWFLAVATEIIPYGFLNLASIRQIKPKAVIGRCGSEPPLRPLSCWLLARPLPTQLQSSATNLPFRARSCEFLIIAVPHPMVAVIRTLAGRYSTSVESTGTWPDPQCG